MRAYGIEIVCYFRKLGGRKITYDNIRLYNEHNNNRLTTTAKMTGSSNTFNNNQRLDTKYA